MLVSGPPDVLLLLLLLLLNTREAHHIWISVVLQPDKSFLKAGFFIPPLLKSKSSPESCLTMTGDVNSELQAPLPLTQFSRSKDCLI